MHVCSQIALLSNHVESRKSNTLHSFCSILSVPFRTSWQYFWWFNCHLYSQLQLRWMVKSWGIFLYSDCPAIPLVYSSEWNTAENFQIFFEILIGWEFSTSVEFLFLRLNNSFYFFLSCILLLAIWRNHQHFF